MDRQKETQPLPATAQVLTQQKFALGLQLLLQEEIVFDQKNAVRSLLRSRQCTDDNPSRGYCEAAHKGNVRDGREKRKRFAGLFPDQQLER